MGGRRERTHHEPPSRLLPGGILLCGGLPEGMVRQMSTEETGDAAGGGQEESLRALVAACEARLTEIADLVAHVRHEINNPLTGVIGQAQLLLREELSQSARRRVETIEQLAGRIRDTVAELRAVQRPQKKG